MKVIPYKRWPSWWLREEISNLKKQIAKLKKENAQLKKWAPR